MKPVISDAMVELHDYRLFRKDRLGKAGGGVAFYLHNTLNASIVARSEEQYDKNPEYIVAEIFSEVTAKLLLAVVYRPPNTGYLNEFENIYMDLQVGYKHSLIMGDFNADMLVNTFESRQMKTFISSASLYLVPYKATHHLKNFSTFLDLCIIDDPEKLLNLRQHDVAFLSAHDIIHITYDFKLERRYCRSIFCRDFQRFNEAMFLADFQDYDWTELFSLDSVDEKIVIFNGHILCCLNVHAPFKRVQFKNFPAPWLDDNIKEAMRDRDRKRRKWRRQK